MSTSISVRLSKDLAVWLDETAARRGTSRAQVAREALVALRERHRARPFLRLIGSVRGARDLSRRKGFSRS